MYVKYNTPTGCDPGMYKTTNFQAFPIFPWHAVVDALPRYG